MDAVLVVGGGGFIGLHTVRRLAAAGFPVWATHSPARPAPAIAGVRWLACDLTASDATAHWPKPCSSVIFLAQGRNWRQFPQSAPDVFAVNVNALQQTMTFALEAQVQRCIV